MIDFFCRVVILDWGGINFMVEFVKYGCDIEFFYLIKWCFEKVFEVIKDGKFIEVDVD